MYGKIQITGQIEVVTGMHIGGSDAFAAIGAVDSPVVRDARTNRPMIPGSSLKGKLRSLLARKYNDAPQICRLFGTAKPDATGRVQWSRLLVSDMFIEDEIAKTMHEQGMTLTEIKFENTIDRLTAVANPRQIERVIRGTVFDMDIIYEVQNSDEITEDFSLLAEGMRLLQYDYIGGHGSRGYGKVRFRNVIADSVVGDIDENTITEINDILIEGIGEKEDE